LPIVRILVLAALTFVGGWTFTTPAYAQSCTFAFTDIDFGEISTATTTNLDTTGQFSASCTGAAGQVIKVCPVLGDGSGGAANPQPKHRRMKNGANALNFQLYSDAGRSVMWGGNGQQATPVVMVTPGQTVTRTVYARYFNSGSSGVSGLYTSQFSGQHVKVAYEYGTGNCVGKNGIDAVPQPSFMVQARRTTGCGVTVPTDMDFGETGMLNSQRDAEASIIVTCGLLDSFVFTVGLGNGENGTSATTRRMRLGSEYIGYGLYRDSSRVGVWGTGGGEVYTSGLATFLGGVWTIPVYGRVPAQPSPPPGQYTDNVVVTVTY